MSRGVSGLPRQPHMCAESIPLALPMANPRIRREMSNDTVAGVDPSEAELVRRVLSGEDEAFRELVRPCEHAVFMATQAILNNEADAEDAGHEPVLKAVNNHAKFRRYR